MHQHSIQESTRIIPEIVLCACILHNICIDAGDVNDEEDAAVRDPIEARADRAEINLACDRILQNHGKLSLIACSTTLKYALSLLFQFITRRTVCS